MGRMEQVPSEATAPAHPPIDPAAVVRPRAGDLVVQRPEGLYCPPGDFYIDPWRPVGRAVITHAHADHARPGSAHYLAADASRHVLDVRLPGIRLDTLPYGAAPQPTGRTWLAA